MNGRVSVLLTSNLCHHGLRDPPVAQERLDLLLHQAAVPPADTHTHSTELRARLGLCTGRHKVHGVR